MSNVSFSIQISLKEAEDIDWFCKSCKQPAMVEDKVKEHTEKLNQIKVVESNLSNDPFTQSAEYVLRSQSR